jgi:hypothetical protein
VFVVGNVTLESILNETFYIIENSNGLDARYLDELPLFEREFYLYKILAKKKKEAEQNGS